MDFIWLERKTAIVPVLENRREEMECDQLGVKEEEDIFLLSPELD